MPYLRHPNIDWSNPAVKPQSNADPANVTGNFVFIIVPNLYQPLPMQAASSLVPDPAVGYITSG